MYIKEINVDMISSPFEMPTATAEIVANDREEIHTLRTLMVEHNNIMVVSKDKFVERDKSEIADLKLTFARNGMGRVYATQIKEVIFNEPATIVYWTDGTKTVVKCGRGDTFDKEKGLALCCMKKMFGNKGNYNNTLKKYAGEEK